MAVHPCPLFTARQLLPRSEDGGEEAGSPPPSSVPLFTEAS
jgi:hypothetical protein